MRKLLTITIIMVSVTAYGQQESLSDTTATVLDEVVVEARNQRLGAEVSTYIPTSKQKNASQTASDLLNRMSIPQLRLSSDDEIVSVSGKSVDIFIDYVPASKDDLKGMRVRDVKIVEYYDFPTDPRFLGKTYVVNFVMQTYEYGGYVKAYGWENTGNAGQVSLYSKVKYKRMTFDIATGAFYINQTHSGGDVYETFRLPQADGSIMEFDRNSIQNKANMHTRTYWPTFKALYSSDRISVQNVFGANFYHTPISEQMGYLSYSSDMLKGHEYWSNSSNRVNSLSYSGYWNFIINNKSSITISPKYVYSHTNTTGLYTEEGIGAYNNYAKDDSHQVIGDITYRQSFGKWGNLNAFLQTLITTNSTRYNGTASAHDHTSDYRIGTGVKYSLSIGKIYGMIGAGLHFDRQEYRENKDNSVAPWFDFSFQYSPTVCHSIRCEYHNMRSMPPASSRSVSVIQSNPFVSYTGNPELTSYGNFKASITYSYIPDNQFNFSAFASTWIVDNRYVYDYKATSTGIIRAITQPAGAYSQWNYGAFASLWLFDHSCQLTAQLSAASVRNAAPYNINKTHFVYAFQANYYLNNWTFSGIYYAPQEYSEGCMVSTWMKTQPFYKLGVGWSNKSWNLQVEFANFARWHWRSDESIMKSPNYDKREQSYSINDHVLVRFAITYTFGFGKKVDRGNEASQQSSSNSGILK